jgi:hypothetical protein
MELAHRSSAEISPADAEWLQKKHREIATEAAFFGYDLSLAGWDYEQTSSPAMADDIVLHYRRQSRDGGVSLFTAVVPRGPARVFVVPILYRSATPFHPAPGSERSLDVFNRAVPGELAAAASEPGGPWLLLAACYADLVGGQAYVMEHRGPSVALLRAPEPTVQLSGTGHTSEIIFTDRDSPDRYTVWDLRVNDLGRLTGAAAIPLADYIARVETGTPHAPKPAPVSAREGPPQRFTAPVQSLSADQAVQQLPPPSHPVVEKPMPDILMPDQVVPSRELPPIQSAPTPQ